MIDQLKAMLRFDEGFRGQPYHDINGALTIGYGHNLDAQPISEAAGEVILADDIREVIGFCSRMIPGWSSLTLARQAVLANMAFNLGMNGLFKFKDLMQALRDENYRAAGDAMLDSKWATQVPRRAHRLAAIMKSGVFPENYGGAP